jgi:hypothetical protein
VARTLGSQRLPRAFHHGLAALTQAASARRLTVALAALLLRLHRHNS